MVLIGPHDNASQQGSGSKRLEAREAHSLCICHFLFFLPPASLFVYTFVLVLMTRVVPCRLAADLDLELCITVVYYCAFPFAAINSC